jgi:hypothetical protein
MVHRILEQALNNNFIIDKKIEEKCKHCSDKERSAMEAERAANKYKQVEYMQNFLGDEFEGVISGVGQRTITFQYERKGKTREEVVGIDAKTDIEKGGQKVKLKDLQETDKALIKYEPEAYTPAQAVKVIGKGQIKKSGGGSGRSGIDGELATIGTDDVDDHGFFFSQDSHRDPVSRFFLPYFAVEFRSGTDLFLVDGKDDISFAQPVFLRRASGADRQ